MTNTIQQTPVLEVKNLIQDFGGLRAINNFSLTINKGEIVALIGPNGAGKTTFFNCITGIYNPTSGDMSLTTPDGQKHRLNGLKTHLITALGMARTFQNIRLFAGMTVLENVMVGFHCRTKAGILSSILRTPATKQEQQETIDKSYELLKIVHLEEFWNETARNLPYGAQRRLEIARAMATSPSVLLLDEPAAGMNPEETRELDDLIRRLRSDYQLSVLLIEHDMSLVMALSDRIYVLQYGSPLASGTPEEIRHNPAVIKAYLGESHNA